MIAAFLSQSRQKLIVMAVKVIFPGQNHGSAKEKTSIAHPHLILMKRLKPA
jgi:hypothetical protein